MEADGSLEAGLDQWLLEVLFSSRILSLHYPPNPRCRKQTQEAPLLGGKPDVLPAHSRARGPRVMAQFLLQTEPEVLGPFQHSPPL